MVTTKPKLKGPPVDMEVPDDIVLKRSSVDPERIGIWCKSHIPCGKKFGPFMGDRVQEATDDMDPTYVWEIVDLSTKEFLFYIDATDEHEGNWMRYINCARYFEEQNIVSEQEGVDIIYRAIKDIYPEEELLTWYEKAPLRRKKGRKARKLLKDETEDEKESSKMVSKPRVAVSRSSSMESNSSMREESEPSTSQSLSTTQSKSDTDDMHVSQRGRRRKVTKYWEMETDIGLDDDEDSEAETQTLAAIAGRSENLDGNHRSAAISDEEWGVTGPETIPKLTSRSISMANMAPVSNPGDYYQFDVKSWHVVKSRIGRKLFQCDICSSVYKHSFSLKRHYIRNHLNYKFVSPTDLMNCCVPTKSIPNNGQVDVQKDVIKQDNDSHGMCTAKDAAQVSVEAADIKDGMTHSPSLDSISSLTKGMDQFSKGRLNSDETSLGSSELPLEEGENSCEMDGANESSNRVNSYEEDTEEYLDSDSEIHSVLDDDTPHGKSKVEEFDDKLSSSDEEDSVCSEASDPVKHSEHKGKPVISIMNVSQLKGNSADSMELDICDNSGKMRVVDSEKSRDESLSMDHRDRNNIPEVKQSQKVNDHMTDASSSDSDKKLSENGLISELDVKKETKSVNEVLSDSNSSSVGMDAKQATSSQEGGSNGPASLDPTTGNKLSSESPQVSAPPGAPPGLPCNLKGEPLYGLFRCNVCAEVFDIATVLKQHLSNHPEATDGRKTFACEKCNMKFAHKQNLMRHQAVHTGTRPYICSYCDKKFPTSTNLRRHEKVHQGHKFTCPHCISTFTQTGDLKKHVRKIHPELFNECGFCTRYFVKKRLLMDHLLEMHDGKTVEENDKEIEIKQEAFRYDLSMDKAESMRLAIAHGKKKPGPKFACTVCRKRFHDYPNMCRHRRLAHQRPIFVPPIRDENGDVVDDAASQACTTFRRGFYDPEDEAQTMFYANVANAIADNLQNFIEGKEEHLSRVETVVKWKGSGSSTGNNMDSISHNKSPKAFVDSVMHNLQEFNFPRDFKLKNAANNYRTVPYSSDGRISWKNKKFLLERKRTESSSGPEESKETTTSQSTAVTQTAPTTMSRSTAVTQTAPTTTNSALMQFLQSDITSVCQTMTSTSILASAELSQPRTPSNLPTPPLLQRKPESAAIPQNGSAPRSMPIRVPQVKTCKICRCLFHNQTLYQTHMYLKHGVRIDPDCGSNNMVSTPARDNRPNIPKPAHMNSAKTCPLPARDMFRVKNGYIMNSLHPAGVTIKTEPPDWEQPTALSSPNSDVTSMEQTASVNASTAEPEDDMKPLDLSKKSHLAGYKLADKPSGSQCVDSTSEKADMSSSTEDEPEVKQEKPPVPEPRYICIACYGRYDLYDELLDHQEHDHPNVKCGYTQLDEEVARNWKITPNPIGVLNVCSTQLPPVTASPKRTNKLACTKCSKTFQCMADLHHHIEDCAEPYMPKMMFVYYYPGTKNRHFFLPGAKGEMVKVEKGQKYRRNLLESPRKKPNSATASVTQEAAAAENISEDSQNALLQRQQLNSTEDLEDDQMVNGKKRRRRNYELLYNPHKHIRRREMAEIIDTPKCSGCNGLFSTISLLERHIPMCRHKHKILDQATPKEVVVVPEVEESEDEDAYDPKKHMCIYCQKQFTYFGMLRKHVFDVCNVRWDLVEKGEYIDEEWEKEINARAGQSQPRTLSRQSSVSSLNGIESLDTGENSMDSKPSRGAQRGRRRRRGNGWYKGKGNIYKKKDNSAGWEWERYFVLDETFMGVYNAVQGDEDEQKQVDSKNSKNTWLPPDYRHDSNNSTYKANKSQMMDGSQETSLDNSHRETLEQMQREKKALFAELTKPANDVDTVVKDISYVQTGKSEDVTPKKSKKVVSDSGDKPVKAVIKAPTKTPVKKDSPQKGRTKAAENLASVKQKLAKKIIENKKLQQGTSRKMNGKQHVEPQKTSKDINEKYVKKRGPKPKMAKSLMKEKLSSPTGKARSNKVKMAILAKVSPKVKGIGPKSKLLKSPLKSPAKIPKTKSSNTVAARAISVKTVSTKTVSTKKTEMAPNVSSKPVSVRKTQMANPSSTKPVSVKKTETVKYPVDPPEPTDTGDHPSVDSTIDEVIKRISTKSRPAKPTSKSVIKPAEGYSSLSEIVTKYSKNRIPNMFLGRPPRKTIEELEEDYEDHPTVDTTIDTVVMGLDSSTDDVMNSICAPIALLSSEDEDNMKLSELRNNDEDLHNDTSSPKKVKVIIMPKKTLTISQSTGVMAKVKCGLSEKAAAIVKGARKRRSEGPSVTGSLTSIKSPGKRTPKRKRKTVLEALDKLSGDDIIKVIPQSSSPVRKLNNVLSKNKSSNKIKDLLLARSKSESNIANKDIAGICDLPKGRGKKRPRSIIEMSSDLPVVGNIPKIPEIEKTVLSGDIVESSPKNPTVVMVKVKQQVDIEGDIILDT